MSLPVQNTRAANSPVRHRYADRVKAIADGSNAFNVLIDDEIRFRMEGDEAWPTQWRLFRMANNARVADCLGIENEYHDLLCALERGAYWMPAEGIERDTSVAPRDATYTRFPEYLRES